MKIVIDIDEYYFKLIKEIVKIGEEYKPLVLIGKGVPISQDIISRQDAVDAMLKLEHDDIELYGCSIPEGFDSTPAINALKDVPSFIDKYIKNDMRKEAP